MPNVARVVLVNAWHDDNKGDSAITEGSLHVLRHAFAAHSIDARFTVVGLNEPGRLTDTATRHVSASWPEAVTLPTPIPTQQRRGHVVQPVIDVPIWFARLVPFVAFTLTGRVPLRVRAVLADADLIVSMGGANLNDDASVNALVSMARLYTLAAPLHAAVRLRQPLLLLGHTLGPFPRRRRAAIAMARRMIGGANLAIVREKGSIAIAKQIGIERVELAPDMAFALVPLETENVRRLIGKLPAPPDRTVVITVRSHPSLGAAADERMIREVTFAVKQLAAQGLCDAVLVAPHTLGPTPIEDDTNVSRQLVDVLEGELPGFPTTFLTEDLAPAELAWLYGQMACMIAVRLHAAILAILLGTPTFAIAYFTHKTQGVMDGVGLGDCVGEFATVSGVQIATSLAPRMGSREQRDTLTAICRANRTELEDRCIRWVADCLGLAAAAESSGHEQIRAE